MIASLVRRNITLYFRDKSGVFFSLLAPLIMFVLYVFFLGNLQTTNIRESFSGSSTDAINFFITSWIFAGILTITTVTTGLAALQVYVADLASGRFRDFAVSPIKRWKIITGYFGSTFIISLVMTTIVLVLGELYVVLNGGSWLTLHNALLTYGVLLLLCGSFAAVSSFIVTFVKSESAYASLSVILGTSIGFLAGVYVPVGSLPAGVANVINTLPFSQAASLVRKFFVQQSVDGLANGHGAADTKLNQMYGLSIQVDGHVIAASTVLGILVAIGIIFGLAAIWRIAQKLK